MLDRLFLAHPRSVDESYLDHARVATRFGVRLIVAGLAAVAHGLVPALFERTASATVKRMHGELLARQPAAVREAQAAAEARWLPEYEI